jgi:hypothetical protein
MTARRIAAMIARVDEDADDRLTWFARSSGAP